MVAKEPIYHSATEFILVTSKTCNFPHDWYAASVFDVFQFIEKEFIL